MVFAVSSYARIENSTLMLTICCGSAAAFTRLLRAAFALAEPCGMPSATLQGQAAPRLEPLETPGKKPPQITPHIKLRPPSADGSADITPHQNPSLDGEPLRKAKTPAPWVGDAAAGGQ